MTVVEESPIYLVVSTIAVIVEPSADFNPNLSQDQITSVLSRPITVGQTADGQVSINSSRDQMDVHLLGNKLDVREGSGEIARAQTKIPTVLYGFLDMLSNPPITSYGVNFIVEVARDNPDQWIGSKFLNPALIKDIEPTISCSLTVLKFNREEKTLVVRFESRPDSISINFNASEQTNTLPDPDQLGKELGKQFQGLADLINRLGS